jgi:uncharacterized membrane protein YsdA (DUF1294 family)
LTKSKSRTYRSAYTTYWRAAGIVGLLIILAVMLGLGWSLFAAWLVTVNGVTWLLLRHDKGQAQRPGAMRVPEAVLLTLLVAGGTLGGLVGMLFPTHHKTRKPIFWVALVAGAILVLLLVFYVPSISSV